MRLLKLLTAGGRKFAVGISALQYGFALALAALIIIGIRPTSGIHVAEVVGAFGLMVSVIVGSYQLANAAGDKWNPTMKTTTTASTVTQTVDSPTPPRPSGMVIEPTGDDT